MLQAQKEKVLAGANDQEGRLAVATLMKYMFAFHYAAHQ